MEAAARSARTTVHFGVFEVDLFSRELFKRGHRIKLQEQPFQILALLLEHPGELVTREVLRQRLWPGETVVNFDDGVNAAIRRLRFALGDSAERPKYIETLPRRGYRFIGQVENGDAHETNAVPADSRADPHSDAFSRDVSPSARNFTPVIAAVIAVFALVATTFFVMTGRPAPPPAPELTFAHVTKSSGIEINPALSPDGQWVAYVAQERTDRDVFLQRIGTDIRVNLTRDSLADEQQPAFSPDGRLIAFRSERDGGGIFIMKTTGESVRRVSDFGFDPSWSPDGRELVVSTEGIVNPLSRTSTSSLWRITLSSGDKRKVFDGDAVQPSWSPDGKRIAFWRTIGNSGQRDIATISSNGGEPVAITNDAAVDWSPIWSPDGKTLYFASDRGGSMNLWRIAIDEAGRGTGDAEAITTPSRWTGDLSIGGNGAQIAFCAGDPHSNIARVGFDPASEKAIGPSVPVTRSTISVMQPAISPDGQWIAYRTEAEQEDIYLSRIDGSEVQKLTDDVAKDRGPSWSPDGKMIGFYSDRGGKYEAWVINRDRSGLKQLTSSPTHAIFFPLWFPDGKKFVVNSTAGSFTVVSPEEGVAKAIDPLPSYPASDRVFRASSLSRDGEWLAGTLYSIEGTRIPGVVVYSIQDRRYRVLTDFGSWPSWLSDGRRLVFGEGNKLFLTNRETGATREILTVDGQIPFGVAAAPDDREIFFAHASHESDVWLLTMK